MIQPEQKRLFADVMRFRSHRCLEPNEKCTATGIRAHSIPNAAVLELLAADGHVIAPQLRVDMETGPQIIFARVGRNKATTFTGLCSTHDEGLFTPIEKNPPDFGDPWHLFLFSYRAVIRELHVSIEGAVAAQLAYQGLGDQGLIPKDVPTGPGLMAVREIGLAYETYQYKRKCDELFLRHDPWGMFFKTSTLKGVVPTVAVSSLTTVALPGVGAITAPPLALTVVPLPTETQVVVGGLSEHRRDVKHFLKFLFGVSGHEQLRRLTAIIVRNCENFVLSPVFFDSLSDSERAALATYFVATMANPAALPTGLPCLFRQAASSGGA